MKVGVSGVVRNPAGEVLLVRTDRFGWELPGGGVETGEDLLTALRREVREEAGCVLDATGRMAGVYSVTRADVLIVVFCASGSTVSPAPRVGEDDVLEAGWFAPEMALRLVTHRGEHRRLEDGLRVSAETVYRVDA